MLRSVDWLVTDVSGQPICPIVKTMDNGTSVTNDQSAVSTIQEKQRPRVPYWLFHSLLPSFVVNFIVKTSTWNIQSCPEIHNYKAIITNTRKILPSLWINAFIRLLHYRANHAQRLELRSSIIPFFTLQLLAACQNETSPSKFTKRRNPKGWDQNSGPPDDSGFIRYPE
jgi:hypothetical protein